MPRGVFHVMPAQAGIQKHFGLIYD